MNKIIKKESKLKKGLLIADASAPLTSTKQNKKGKPENEPFLSYKKLWDKAPVAHHLLDTQGRILAVNLAETDLLGYTEKELIGKKIFEFIKASQREDAINSFQNKISGSSVAKLYNSTYIAKDGRQIHVSMYDILQKNDKGSIIGLMSTMLDDTEKKESETKLKANQKKFKEAKHHYERLIDTITDSICVVDNNCKIVSYNKAFSDRVGVSIKKLKGMSFNQVIMNYDLGKIEFFCQNDCNQNDDCPLQIALSSGRAQKYEIKTTDAHGMDFFLKIDVMPTLDEQGNAYQLVITIKDISERKRDEEEIRRLNELNQKILDNSPTSILMLDKHGVVLAANEMAKKMMERPTRPLIGRDFLKSKQIIDNQTLASCYGYLLSKGEPFYYDNLPYTPAGQDFKKHLNIIAVPLYSKDKELEGALSIAVDNTEAIRAKENLEDLNRNLEKKVVERTRELDSINRRLSNILDLKSKFIADASHELRTPLTVIQGNLELAAREATQNNQDVPEIYNIAIAEVERMGKILSDLTMLTNLDSGSDKILHEQIDLRGVVISVAQSLKIIAEQKKITLNYKKTIPKTIIKGDETKIEKLLLNIVRNAIKYTPAKGKVKISIDNKGTEAKIIVEDNGVGIPEKDLPFIFERFYRVDKARATEEGSGLGLAIAKWIAECHRGSINVQSKEGVGSIFTIHLPFDHKKQRLNLSLF